MSNPAPSKAFVHSASDARLCAVLGPTNTGKTHYAIERMCGYATGMIGLPLRLLAREVYDRVVALKGESAVALVTGEEKIIPKLPAYFVCTVEAMPLERQVDFLAVDEIQLCGDLERGHVFTDRLLHARGRFETLFLGARTFAPLFHRLLPGAEIMVRERLSHLAYSGPKKLTRLPPRTAIVAFSTEKVYAIAELIRRQKGGAAVVMGSLSPKTRNAQVELFQKGEVDFLVATDAIGMGLNMDIAHVAFSGLTKFDGRHTRHLTAQEIGQIAGRAGRHMSDGTFGVTGECHDLDEDLVHAVENHEFAPLEAAQWRNHKLEFSTLDALLKSLTQPPATIGLHLAKEALDETALRALAQEEEIAAKIRNHISLRTLWEACQLPDFRKVGMDEHLKLVSLLFWARLSPDGVVPEEWFAAQVADLDKMEGDIDTLSSRLSGVRTLSYIANRGGWLKRSEHWRDVARDLEERLSDKLHEALVQRFIDQRTGALLKALNADEDMRPQVTPEGQVMIEGHVVGELKGLAFKLSTSESVVADKALRQAANRAVLPLLKDRLRDLGQTSSKALSIKGAQVWWQGAAVAAIEPSDYFSPKIRLLSDIDHPAMNERALRRISDYVRQTSLSRLKTLARIKAAAEAETTLPAVRGIAFQLFENGGFLRRDEALKLTPEDKAALKALGVSGHRYAWFLSEALNPKIRDYMRVFGGEGQRKLTCKGLVKVGDLAPVSMRVLSLLDKIMGAGIWKNGVIYVREADFAALKMAEKQRDRLLVELGFVKMPAQMFPAVKTAPIVAEPEAAEAPVEAEADTAAEPEAVSVEAAAEPVIEAAPEPVAETVAAEPAPAETPEMEERVGWRQTSFEPRQPRPKRPPKPERKAQAEGAGDARPPRPHKGKPDHKRGPKPDGKPGERHHGERPPEKREPYVNPYSPFAVLAALKK